METHLIVGVFDDAARAREAVDRLVEWGFTRDNVQLASADTLVPDRAPALDAPARQAGIEDRLARLCGDATGAGDIACYAESIRRGNAMVTVTSGSEEGADSAAGILKECGAVDLEVHERYLRDSGWHGSSGEAAARTAARRKDGVRIYVHSGDTKAEPR